MFICISGVSASGKNTVMHELVKRRQNLKFLEFSSGTTRAKRDSDENFKAYVYMSKEEFLKRVEKGEFYEYELVHDNYYGTFLNRLENVVQNQDFDFMRDIDVKGNVNLKKFFTGKCPMVSIFLDASDDVLRQRLIARGDNPQDIEKRLSRAVLERSYKSNYDLVIENIDLEKTIQTILDFIDKAKNKQ